MHDIINNIGVALLAAPQTVQAAALESAPLDTRGTGAAALVVLVGNIGDTLGPSDRLDLKIEHADDNGSGAPAAFAACADADVLYHEALAAGLFKAVDENADEQKRYVIGYRGTKRFVRIVATPVSLSSGGPVAVLGLTGNASHLPVDNT